MSIRGQTLSHLAKALGEGAVTSRALVESVLASIAENDCAFTLVDSLGARAAADHTDRLRAEGRASSAFAGIPISVKDLFDVAGQTSTAGSTILADTPHALEDAPVISRLRDAGLIIIGRSHMSEFAFTGLGLNPHYPPIANPVDPDRVPGGSSGGAAVSVALGQACVGLGTDTGGSVRIPASFCGLVGFKPTQRRVTRAGAVPLSITLDSIGPIANSVSCCRAIDGVISDDGPLEISPLHPASLTVGVPSQFVLDDLDDEVARSFERALTRLSLAGIKVITLEFPELTRITEISAKGAISNAEAFAWHRRMGYLKHRSFYDQNVLARIEIGGTMSAGDYLDLIDARAALIASSEARTNSLDAVICPTTSNVAPRINEVADPEAFARQNRRALRNTNLFNFLDRSAVSLPMSGPGETPTGLMVVGETLGDARILDVAEAISPIMR